MNLAAHASAAHDAICSNAMLLRGRQISKLHEEVSRVLWAMGVFHTNEALTPDGLFCVDIALEGEKAHPASTSSQTLQPRVPERVLSGRVLCNSSLLPLFTIMRWNRVVVRVGTARLIVRHHRSQATVMTETLESDSQAQ